MTKKDQEKSDQDLVALVKSRYEKASRATGRLISSWEEARLFYRGDQWLQPKGSRYVPMTTPNWRVRLTVNKFIPIIESACSTYLKVRPIIIANAMTDEDQDIKTAKISEMLLRYYYEELVFDEINFDAVLWMLVTGSAFYLVDWDPTKGRKIPAQAPIEPVEGEEPPEPPAEGEEAEPEQEEQDEAPELVSVGQPTVEVIDPFSLSVEPGAKKLEDAHWVIVTKLMHRADIEARWDKELPEGGDSAPTDIHQPVFIDRDSKYLEKERFPVHFMFQRPSRDFPQGRKVVTTREVVLANDALPHGEIQIEHVRGIPLPGEMYPTSLVSQGIPLQLELNRGRSQLIENRNLCSRPQIISAFGAIDQESWDNRPGSILPWDPIAARGIEPHFLSPPQVPQWVLTALQIAEDDLMDLTSRHEVSQGSTASNVTSGRQAAIYKGADDSRLTPSIRRFEKSLAKVGKWMLREAKDHLDGEQIIRIVGTNRRGEYMHFAANDISDTANISFEIASQLPWARESQRQQIMYLNQIGKIDDQTMFELLEMPTSTRIYENEQQHKLNARLENSKLKQIYFPPLTTDNHAIHLREHEEEANRPEFREQLIGEMIMQAMSTGDEAQIPGSVQNLMNHLEAHRRLLPAPAAPEPITRVNLNVEKLIADLMMTNPMAAQKLLEYAANLMSDSAGMKPENMPQQEAPTAVPEVGAEQIGTPAGGMDGRMYQTQGPGQMESMSSEGQMYGGEGG